MAGGSIDAIDRILDGEVEHAFHPGGGLHHAMPHRASGFCIYNDVALAVARARDAGHRVLYVDLDVHHGDGTQAMFWDDPQVLTFSIHETPLTLFPGTGFVDEDGGDGARGTSVNVPLQPYTRRRVLAGRGEACRSRAGRSVPAHVPGQPARLRHPRLRPAGAPAPDDARVSRGDARCSIRSPTSTPTAAGLRPAAAATTPTGSCRARGRWCGWRRRIAIRLTRPTPDWRRRWADESERFYQSPPPSQLSRP